MAREGRIRDRLQENSLPQISIRNLRLTQSKRDWRKSERGSDFSRCMKMLVMMRVRKMMGKDMILTMITVLNALRVGENSLPKHCRSIKRFAKKCSLISVKSSTLRKSDKKVSFKRPRKMEALIMTLTGIARLFRKRQSPRKTMLISLLVALEPRATNGRLKVRCSVPRCALLEATMPEVQKEGRRPLLLNKRWSN
jgi:hypothetical protein